MMGPANLPILTTVAPWVTLTDVPLWLSILGQVVMVLGAALFAISALGMFRLPDLYTKSSGVATSSGLGISLVITGVFLLVPGWETVLKLIAAIVLQFLTAAVGEMAISRSAYLVGTPLYSPTKDNALADESEQAEDDARNT